LLQLLSGLFFGRRGHTVFAHDHELARGGVQNGEELGGQDAVRLGAVGEVALDVLGLQQRLDFLRAWRARARGGNTVGEEKEDDAIFRQGQIYLV
jgi:hypothetical protein